MQAHSVLLELPESLDEDYLWTHANVDALKDQYQQHYQYIRRSAQPAGFVVHADIVFKLYHMLRETEPLPRRLKHTVVDFILAEVGQGRVDAKQGVGFAILSQGFLSINIWGRGNVLFTQTYTVEDSEPDLSPKPMEKTGVACTWEIRIMQHEYSLWQAYLESGRTAADKQAYLQNFVSGPLF